MKKIYFFLIIILPLVSSAQITINQGDLPLPGWGYINATDSTYSAAIPPGGTNQSWNYATLQNLLQDSLLFISSAGTPYAGSFPNANLATYNPYNGNYGYFISNSTGFYLNGAASSATGALVNNPAQMFIPVPFTYNDTYSGYSRVQIDTTYIIPFPVDTIAARIVIYTSINILADAYGSLITPSMNVTNTLRTKTTLLETDSVYIDTAGTGNYIPLPFTPPSRQTTNFKWLRNGGGTLILEMDGDSLGTTATSSSYLLLFVSTGVNEINHPVAVSAFPNPSSDKVTFTFENKPDHSTLDIINGLGQTVESYDVSRLNSFTMTTSHLRNGMYYYLVQGEKGAKAKGKFTVLH